MGTQVGPLSGCLAVRRARESRRSAPDYQLRVVMNHARVQLFILSPDLQEDIGPCSRHRLPDEVCDYFACSRCNVSQFINCVN